MSIYVVSVSSRALARSSSFLVASISPGQPLAMFSNSSFESDIDSRRSWSSTPYHGLRRDNFCSTINSIPAPFTEGAHHLTWRAEISTTKVTNLRCKYHPIRCVHVFHPVLSRIGSPTNDFEGWRFGLCSALCKHHPSCALYSRYSPSDHSRKAFHQS